MWSLRRSRRQTSKEEECTAVFEPVVPLPPLIRLSSGTENEKPIFSATTKLYRFSSTEWKERGFGDIQIFEQKEDPLKNRMLLINEGVPKVLLNHWISQDLKMSYHRGNSKVVTWGAPNYSGGSILPSLDVFAASFQTKEDGLLFKATVERLVDLVGQKKNLEKATKSVQSKAKAEESKKAEKLKKLEKLKIQKLKKVEKLKKPKNT